MFGARALWLAALFIFLKDLSPGFGSLGTPLFFYQTKVLHFGPKFLAWLGVIYQGAAILGALLYGVLCTRLPLARLLVAGILLSVAGSLLFLGYHSRGSAQVIQAASGGLGIFVSVALMDLAARAAPRGGEAMAYSLLMSAFNLGLAASDILGSWLYGSCHLSLWTLIWISVGTTALTLPAIYLLPKSVLARSDRG